MLDSPFALKRREAIEEQVESPIKETDQDVIINAPQEVNNAPIAEIEHDPNCAKCDRGIIKPESVGPAKMIEINERIGNGIAHIRRTTAPEYQRAAISQLQADAYKCEG